MRARRSTAVILALTATAALSACGTSDKATDATTPATSATESTATSPESTTSGDADSSTAPTAPASTSLTPSPSGTAGPAEDATLLVPRTDLVAEQPLAWKPAGSQGNAVYISVTTGNPRCQGVRVTKEETQDSVKIAAFVGAVPGAPDGCTREAVIGKVKVELDEPLGSRSLLHAPGEPTAPAGE